MEGREINQETVINRLIEMLDDQNKQVVAEAINSLTLFGETCIPFLIKALSGKRTIKNGVLEILERLEVRDVDFFNIIKEEIDHAYTNLLDIDVLGQMEKNDAVELLIQHLTETNNEIVETLFKILKILDREGKLKIVEKGLKTKDKNQLAMAIETLESFVNPKFVGNLIPLIDEIPNHERINIAKKRLNLKSDDQVNMLKRLLEKGSRTTRLCALYLIGNLAKDEQYVDIIKGFLDSQDKIIKETASLAFEKIKGKSGQTGGSAMLSTMDKILFLKKVPIFSDLKVRELTAISSIAEEKEIKTDQVIFKEGDEGDSMCVVIAGGVSVIKNYDKPGATILANISEGDYFGEMALFEAAPRSATVKTDSDTKLLDLGKLEFEEIMQEYPSISINICKVLSHRLRTSSDKMADCRSEVHRSGESRKHPRFHTELKARIDHESSSADTLLDNISLGGAFVKSEKTLSPDTKVTISIDTEEKRGVLSLEGTVLRSISSDVKGMSIQFSETTPEVESFIKRFLTNEDENEEK
jgi:CRP-like cAMP-binding protein/HEAT repeat protein